MSHPNAPLTPVGRLKLIVRILDEGRSVTQATDEIGVSRLCGYYWLRRFRDEGVSGLVGRSIRPHSAPRRTPFRSRRTGRRAPNGGGLGATAHRAAPPHGRVHRLRHPQAPRAQLPAVSRPFNTGTGARALRAGAAWRVAAPHIKKLGRIPDGGGWPFSGEDDPARHGPRKRTKPGYEYLHVAVDDHTRLVPTRKSSQRAGNNLSRLPEAGGGARREGVRHRHRAGAHGQRTGVSLTCIPRCRQRAGALAEVKRDAIPQLSATERRASSASQVRLPSMSS